MAGRSEELDTIRDAARPLLDSPRDYDALLDAIGERRIVLLGEASHGTHEFYQQRAEITKRLIAEKGFHAVAVEADWPDAQRVNRYVQLRGSDQDAVDALADFKRYPAWMWRNADVLDFIGWLREYNDEHRTEDPAGFYGLDLYSLHTSIAAVLAYPRTNSSRLSRTRVWLRTRKRTTDRCTAVARHPGICGTST
jgi:erythromycin esterase-like protein